jgi:hypothetical protein
MESILILDGLCTWRSFSRLLLTGAATVLAFAGSLGIAKGSPVVGCPSSPITLAMASQLDVPESDTPCEFTISDFVLAPDSVGLIYFFWESADLGPIATSGFEATNVGTQAEFCYSDNVNGGCSFQATGPLDESVEDSEGPYFDEGPILGELSVYLSGTAGGQPATLGLFLRDDGPGENGELIAIPEPSTYATLGVGVLAIVVFRRKIGRTVL